MDMKVSLLFILSTTLLELFSGVSGQSQSIVFNLKDPESNEVITLGQENVALVCHITNTANADIRITNVAGEIVATNMNAGNCLEHTISRLTEEDNGNYVCQVRYMDDVTMVDTNMGKSLPLNVESGDQQCFRNGTSDQAFGVGDTLLLSCYCTSTINCNWISTVVGSTIGISIPVYETVEFDGNKRIIRVVVGPLKFNDMNTRYDCYYGSRSEQRCAIGPTTASSNDFVLNAVNPSTILRECPTSDESSSTPMVPRNTTRRDGETETTTPLSRTTTPTSEQVVATTVRPEESIIVYIIIAVVLLILFLLVIFLIIIVLCRRRKKKVEERDGRQEPTKTAYNNNVAYDASDTGRMDGGSTKHSNQPLPDVIGHDDISPYGVPSVSGVRNDNDNGPTDPKEVQYASVNRPKLAEVSHYGLRSAVLVGQENAEEDDEEFFSGEVTEYRVPAAFRAEEDDEEFFSGEVTEYRVPVAFRAEEDFEISRGGENFDAQELPLRYS